jgi:trimeric autotransporter adhesin
MKIVCVLLLTLASLGCGYGSMHNYNMTTGTSVQMSQIVPNSATAGVAGFMLTVNGSGFTSSSVVYWNSMALSTQYVSGSQLVAGVPASEVASPTTVQVYVNSNGMVSNMMKFTVQ